MQEENSHEIEDNISYTHCFIYKGKQYPFKIDFFKYSSRYVFRILSELENKKNVQLVDEEIEKEDILTEDGIISLIKYDQHEKIQFTKENIHTLNYLSKKYEIQSLQEKTIKYIEDHQIDLIIDILIFNTEKSTEDKRIYESILSEHLLEHIKDERLYRLSLPTLYRIIKEYEEKRKEKLCQNQIEEESNDNDSTMKSKDINDDQERDKLFEFLFKCLDIYKKNASVLFSLVDFGENKLKYFNRLSSDYSKIFDFHFIKTQTVDLIYKEVNDILSKSYLNEEKIKQQEIKIQSLEKTISELNTDLNEMKSILSQTSSKVTNEIETNQKEQNIKINQIQEQSKNEINQLKLMINELKDEISKISSLTEIIIPSSVTTFENSAFAGCSSLTQITIKYLIPTGKAWDMKDNDYNCFSIEDKSCEVISSSIYENERFAKYLFDGQKEQNGKNNVWASVYEDPNAFIQINFAQPVISNVIKITSRNSVYYKQTPTHFELFGINNQNQEESLSKIRVSWEKDQTKLFLFINEKPYPKYKFKFYEFKFNGHVAIAELNLGQI